MSSVLRLATALDELQLAMQNLQKWGHIRLPYPTDRLGHDPAVLLMVYAHLLDATRNEPALAIARLLDD